MQFRNVLALSIATIVVALAWCYSSTHAQQNEVPNYLNLQVVTYASGSTGFFDERTGMLYVYDSRCDECVFIRKLEKLGEPMKHIRDAEVVKPKN